LELFIDLLAVVGECLMNHVEYIGVIVLDEYVDRSFKVGLCVEHAEVGNLFGIQLCWSLFLELFSEKTHLVQRIGLLEPKTNLANPHTNLVGWNFSFLADGINDFLFFELLFEQIDNFLVSTFMNEIVEFLDKFIYFSLSDPVQYLSCSSEIIPVFCIH